MLSVTVRFVTEVSSSVVNVADNPPAETLAVLDTWAFTRNAKNKLIVNIIPDLK